MSLDQISDNEVEGIGPSKNGTYTKAKGGTEMMAERIQSVVDELDLNDQVNIIHSRVRNIDSSKKNILVLHDLWNDPESMHLREKENRDKFDAFVFVSNQQLQTYNMAHGVPFGKSIVMKNAIKPLGTNLRYKDKSKINVIYHTTPHRGLELLVPAFEEICKHHDNVHLDVYSSFDIYGWGERDEPYQELFQRVKDHPNMTYHGYQPNEVVRKALNHAHIFAYPNIWQETSCMAVMEAMSAGCAVVCPNYGALYETTAGFAFEYQYSEDPQDHVNRFYHQLDGVISNFRNESNQVKIQRGMNYANHFYSWESRKDQWKELLTAIVR